MPPQEQGPASLMAKQMICHGSSDRFSWTANRHRIILEAGRPSRAGSENRVQARAARKHTKTPSASPHSDNLDLRLRQYRYSAGPDRSTSLLNSDSAVPNFSRMYAQGRRRRSVDLKRHRLVGAAPTMRNPTRRARVRCWDGHSRTTSEWDGLRRDPELWFQDGDCFIHLYAKGQSRRGPSFRIPFDALREAHCDSLFQFCYERTTVNDHSPNGASDLASKQLSSVKYELYIPGPEVCTREESFQWHITTRNFFAFIFTKPVVGANLGRSLVDLQERMGAYRSEGTDNKRDFLEYAEEMGYLDFPNCPDYALAMLYYAEHFQIEGLFIDAFSHCVGMNERLCMSGEFEPVNRVTKALITRAFLEMDLHLSRVMRAVTGFLEDELSSAYLGVGQGARLHMDRFRSFLHAFYVQRFGYWPPSEESGFSKDLYQAMYFDFRNLYDYLVDAESTDSFLEQKPASGGICVLQNVQAFDRRQKYTPLPNPLPLLPKVQEPRTKTQSQRALVALKLGTKQAKTEQYMTVRAALTTATNTKNVLVMASPIVKEYMRFERESCCRLEEKVSVADARKVRWILIYTTLQMLVSVVRAPAEVRDSEDVPYPLCCIVAGLPPWTAGAQARKAARESTKPTEQSAGAPAYANTTPALKLITSNQYLDAPPDSPISIHPDCELEYFSQRRDLNDQSQSSSSSPSVETPAPLRINQTAVRQNSSMRSLKALSFSTFASRRSSVKVKAPSKPFCEILVHGYGNGLNPTVVGTPSSIPSPSLSAELNQLPPDFCSPPDLTRTPVLESFRLEDIHLGPFTTSLEDIEPIMTSAPLTPSNSTNGSIDSAGGNRLWSSGEDSMTSLSSADSVTGDGADDKQSHPVLHRSSSVYSFERPATAKYDVTKDLDLSKDANLLSVSDTEDIPRKRPSLLGFDFQLSSQKARSLEQSAGTISKSTSTDSLHRLQNDMHITEALKLVPAMPPPLEGESSPAVEEDSKADQPTDSAPSPAPAPTKQNDPCDSVHDLTLPAASDSEAAPLPSAGTKSSPRAFARRSFAFAPNILKKTSKSAKRVTNLAIESIDIKGSIDIFASLRARASE